jgi:hypothetical protein
MRFLIFLLLVCPCMAQEHKFYDRIGKLELAGDLAMAAADSAQTCHNLATGGHEYMLRTQNCAKVNIALFGQVAIQEGVAYFLHRTGHHKIERVARLFSIEENARGIAYSAKHGAL